MQQPDEEQDVASSVVEDLKRVESRLLARIRELEASNAELEELRAVAARLGLDTSPGPRPRAVATSRATTRARERRHLADTGARRTTRRERVLELVREQPGISVPELVDAMGVNRTSLYPVVRQLISDGLLRKDGKHVTLVEGR
jgi:hypothetical protein